VFDARQSNMRDLTAYAPIRVALTGIWRILFGAILAIPAGLLIWIGPSGEAGATRAPGDMPPWWMFVIGLAFAFAALTLITGGVGRIVSAFAKDCHFRAGAEGMAVRLPKQGWFGRFTLIDHQFKWEEIESLIHFTRSINLIPVARELHIRLYGGKEVTIERFYFSASIKRLREQLLEIRMLAGK
jgi:hypothetical protein